ncbi:MAG: undecaprenyldiphospho-muramoylpentapeptide beta-N-acetylglucosaminyltransferase [Gammaproteobacteria bacterium]|nr:undecaprenyldiphospho-muramoylpentapeptide beta-N-acetylglucosaminyltransferase [Gammaproteobacteria bacterium]
MKILINAAGSGGHIYPAISFAVALQKRINTAEIIFISTIKQIEEKILKNVNFKVFAIDYINQPSSTSKNGIIFLLQYLYFLIKFIKASIKTFFLLIRIKPDIAVGFGGISSLVAILGAKSLGMPTLIHEQNVTPGLANRFLARSSTKVAISFSQTRAYLKGNNIYYTGNPLRQDLRHVEKQTARQLLDLDLDKFVILVFGGSQGASFINNCIVQAIARLGSNLRDKLQMIHLTGEKDFGKINDKYKDVKIKVVVQPYLFDMSVAYSAADLVICRAGATSLSELSYFNCASILIPYPYAGAHQLINANVMQQQRAARIVYEDENSVTCLSQTISELMQQPETLESMRRANAGLANPKAADNLVALMMQIVKNKN